MTAEYDEILDGLFHASAWAAYLDQAREQQGPPDCVATRQRAYAYYEAALAGKNRRKSTPQPVDGEPMLAEEMAG